MKKFIKFFTGIFFLLVVALAAIPFWPRGLWWLANIIQVLPLILLIIPFILLLLPALFLGMWRTALVQLLGILLVIFGLMRFVPNGYLAAPPAGRPADSIRVLSMNIGRDKDIGLRFNIDKFIALLKETDPDIIALQEAGFPSILKEIRQAFPGVLWYGSFKDGFSLISKMPINLQSFNGNGRRGVVNKYKIFNDQYVITFYNVHFMTPRPGLEYILTDGLPGITAMKKVTDLQADQAAMASSEIRSSRNVIVAGDFNLTTIFPLYRLYWSKFQNALSQKGTGFEHTKFFLFHGVRIDHVLCDADWQVISARVGPSMDSDHRPVIVDLRFVGRRQPAESAPPAAPAADYRDAYHYENFEINPGSLDANGTGDLIIDYENTAGHGNTLMIQARSSSATLTAGLRFNAWDIDKDGTLGFSYRIPASTPVCLQVKTRFEDWLCLGGSVESQCPGPKPDTFVHLIDDNQWHQVKIDVRAMVKTLLPAMRYLNEVRLTIEHPRPETSVFWIDDLAIF